MNYDIGSTHIPVLIALGLTRPIRRVLELGAGLYSTPTFLNTKVFSKLERLITFEDDPMWRMRVAGSDPRLRLVEILPPLTDPYDLIFVDNATDLAVRAATIRRVCDETRDVPVVIHDAEDANYIPEIERFEWHHTIRTYTKWTAIAYNGKIGNHYIPTLTIEGNCSRLAPTDVDGWLEVLRP